MTTDTKNLGGRPPKPPSERLVPRTFGLKPRHWAKIDLAGRPALEALLEAWEPEPPKNKPVK
jgi:hypothetical protein